MSTTPPLPQDNTLKKGRYKLFIRFNSNSSRTGTTLWSFDNPYDPELGLKKLKEFIQKVKLKGQLSVAIIYDTQNGGIEMYRMYGGGIDG